MAANLTRARRALTALVVTAKDLPVGSGNSCTPTSESSIFQVSRYQI